MTVGVRCVSGRRVDRNKYQIQIPLPPKIDPTVTMMTVEEKPDVTYSDIGGCKEQVPPPQAPRCPQRARPGSALGHLSSHAVACLLPSGFFLLPQVVHTALPSWRMHLV